MEANSAAPASRLHVEGWQCLTDFLETELDLGMTFCQRAQLLPQSKGRERNVANARRALESAKKFAKKLDQNHGLPGWVQEKVDDLESALGRLEV